MNSIEPEITTRVITPNDIDVLFKKGGIFYYE